MILTERLKRLVLNCPGVTSWAKKIADKAAREADIFVRVPAETIFTGFPIQEFLEKRADSGKSRYLLTDCKQAGPIDSNFKGVISSVDGLRPEEIANSIFFIYFVCDSDALPELRKIAKHGGQFVPHFECTKTNYRFVNRLAYESLKKRWALGDGLGPLSVPIIHENLCEALELTKDVEGDFVEIGVFRGGSAVTAMNYIRQLNIVEGIPARKAWLLDTFDGFNYPEATKSADIFWAGTHRLSGPEAMKKQIGDLVSNIGVPFELVESNICSSELPPGIGKISVANIDVDMYEAVLAALHKCADRMADGGIMICEDAASTPALYGAFLAMEEFLGSSSGKRFLRLFKQGQYFLLKKAH